MSEPGLPANHLLPALPNDELSSYIRRQFPGAIIQEDSEGRFILFTVHGTGETERKAMEDALENFNNLRDDCYHLPDILGEVERDLKEQRGMSRLRHDSLQDLLNIAENALNGGVLIQAVPWIMVPSYTRRIEELRRRVSTRLNMVAAELQAEATATKRAQQSFKGTHPVDKAVSSKWEGQVPDGLTAYQHLLRAANKR